MLNRPNTQNNLNEKTNGRIQVLNGKYEKAQGGADVLDSTIRGRDFGTEGIGGGYTGASTINTIKKFKGMR